MEGKRRYPTDEQGVPFKPEGLDECHDVCFRPDGKQQDKHHLAWPRDRYRTSVERQYRECGSMVIKACRCKHIELHNTYRPPKMPDRMAMIDVVQGDIRPDVAEVFIRRRDA